ncbi:tetratricopeptide repeat protein [Bryobacter aggregatus]|uniref:tetratricopeptide repeat protein n=1 Tax=Bryobacter aggregatus TaxID=360054 RepID=UPI0004E0B21B|nr:tetratricopeptide repeat protein [Bryobacter aggregatus]
MRLRTLFVSTMAVSALLGQPHANNFTTASTATPSSVANPIPPPEKAELSPEMRGDIFMARKMFREAVEMYQQMPANSPVTWNKVGIAYHQLSQLDLARKQYERSVKLNPKYAEAINNLGTVAYAQKNYRRATNHYRKALLYAPNSASIHSNLGTALFARKKYELAFTSYQTALSLDPNVFENRGSQGTVLQERSVDERAKFHYHLAKLYAKGGQNDRAMQYLRKALEEGFSERDKIAGDEAFRAIKDEPEFQTLLKSEFRVL